MSKATRAFKMDGALKELRSLADFFDATDISDEIEDAVNDFAFRGKQWADATADVWRTMGGNFTPYITGNLAESVVVEDALPTFRVGVDLNRLLGPKVMVGKRGNWAGKEVVISDYDYTEEADKIAVSGYGKGFIDAVWFEYARNHAKQLFSGELK